MIGTIKTVDIRKFYGLTLTKVELCEYVLKLYFGETHRIDVEEYWEYVGADTKQLDRCLSQKLRKQFQLDRLVFHKLISSDSLITRLDLKFDNDEHLIIFSSQDISKSSLTFHANTFGKGL